MIRPHIAAEGQRLDFEVEMEQFQRPNQSTSPDTEVGRDEKTSITQPPTTPDPSFIAKRPPDISLKQLINKLNLLNFQNQSVSVVFRHRIYRRTMTLQAQPQPCQDAHLVCQWTSVVDIDQVIDNFEFQCLYVPKDQQLYEVNARVKGMDDRQIRFELPPLSREISERKVHRHPCKNVSVIMFQNGATFFGELVDYGAFQFRVSISTVPPQTFRWIDKSDAATIVFTKGQETLFSGDCRIVKQQQSQNNRQLIMEPVKNQIRRFSPREFRSNRRKLVPSPDMVFEHPLYSSQVNLRIHDISGSGFSVEEDLHTAVLLPGMIIPALDLTLSDGSALRCMAQVVYSHRQPDTTMVRSGLAILDMPVDDHTRLLALLHQTADANIYICKKLDMQALWDFFFDTGFIYPQKYKFIEAHKEKIQSTYDKLYNESPGIASHFIYQANGRILAHMAMVRFYDRSWLIHHHAAIRSEYQLAGISVLNQVGQFINDCHRLDSMNMDYTFCFYRPENKFPAHVFGGAARHINNQQICSVDHFAYYHHSKSPDNTTHLPKNWQLTPVDEEDLRDLSNFYGRQSGGLMLGGLHLDIAHVDCSEIKKAYQQIDLIRDRQILALKYKEKLRAVFMANHADLGLNMSDLTNSVTVMVVNPDSLTKELLLTATDHIVSLYGQQEVPVLLFPQETVDELEIDSEKSYCLWVYHTQNLDPYFRHLKRFLKFARH